MKSTMILAILLFSAAIATLSSEPPFNLQQIIGFALLFFASALAMFWVLKANSKLTATLRKNEDQISGILDGIRQSESEILGKFTAQSTQIETLLRQATNDLSDSLTSDILRTHELIQSQISKFEAALGGVNKQLLALQTQSEETQQSVSKKAENLNSKMDRNTELIESVSSTQRQAEDALKKEIQGHSIKLEKEFQQVHKKIDSAAKETKEELCTVRNDLRTQVNQAAATTSSALLSLGSATLAQTQSLSSLFANPSKDGSFGVDRWEFNDGNLSKTFTPGRLLQVLNRESNTVTKFYPSEDGETITSDIYIQDILRYRTLSSALGAPIKGWEFDEEENVKVEYSYDNNGQFSQRKIA